MIVGDATSEIISDAASETLSFGEPPQNEGYFVGHCIPPQFFKNQPAALLERATAKTSSANHIKSVGPLYQC